MISPDFEYSVAEKREMLFIEMYQKAFPAAAKFVKNKGGSLDDAREIFQDALVLYYEQVHIGGRELKFSDKAYLLGIVKHLWYGRCRENSFKISLDNLNLEDIADSDHRINISEKVLKFLEKAGQKCMDLLMAFYYDGQSLAEVASKFGFSGVRSATVQKYKCLEKVRDKIKSKSYSYEDFIE